MHAGSHGVQQLQDEIRMWKVKEASLRQLTSANQKLVDSASGTVSQLLRLRAELLSETLRSDEISIRLMSAQSSSRYPHRLHFVS